MVDFYIKGTKSQLDEIENKVFLNNTTSGNNFFHVGGYFVDLLDYISMLLLIILFFGSLYVGNQLKFFCSAVKISFSKNPELPEKAISLPHLGGL